MSYLNNLLICAIFCMYWTKVYQVIVVSNLLGNWKRRSLWSRYLSTLLVYYSTTKLILSFFLSTNKTFTFFLASRTASLNLLRVFRVFSSSSPLAISSSVSNRVTILFPLKDLSRLDTDVVWATDSDSSALFVSFTLSSFACSFFCRAALCLDGFAVSVLISGISEVSSPTAVPDKQKIIRNLGRWTLRSWNFNTRKWSRQTVKTLT